MSLQTSVADNNIRARSLWGAAVCSESWNIPSNMHSRVNIDQPSAPAIRGIVMKEFERDD